MHPTTRTLLQDVLNHFSSDPSHWIKKSTATTINGEHVGIDDPRAECFCLAGALSRFTPRLSPVQEEIDAYFEAQKALCKVIDANFAEQLNAAKSSPHSHLDPKTLQFAALSPTTTIVLFNDLIATREQVLQVLLIALEESHSNVSPDDQGSPRS